MAGLYTPRQAGAGRAYHKLDIGFESVAGQMAE